MRTLGFKTERSGSWANWECALSGALFRRVDMTLAKLVLILVCLMS
jgi:hypothetical protein